MSIQSAMGYRPRALNNRVFPDAWYDARSGLTPGEVRPQWPIIFETRHYQGMLLRIARDGQIRAYGTMYYEPLVASGLITDRKTDGHGTCLALNLDFYTLKELRALLSEMNSQACAPIPHPRGKSRRVTRIMGRMSFMQFETLHILTNATQPLTFIKMRQRFPTATHRTLLKGLRALREDQLIEGLESDALVLTANLPAALSPFVGVTMSWLRANSSHFDLNSKNDRSGAAPPALRDTNDQNLPTLFGTERAQNTPRETPRRTFTRRASRTRCASRP